MVRAGAAFQGVVAVARVEDVVTGAAAQQVRLAVAGQGIVMGGADQVLDADQGVATGVAALAPAVARLTGGREQAPCLIGATDIAAVPI
jgi:hypothetical protein